MNRPITKFYNWDDAKAAAAELQQTKTATDSCRDGWNVRYGSNVLKILHSVGGRVDCVLLVVLVVLLSQHICDLILNKKHCKSLCWGKYMNLLMLLWKTGCIGCLECQNILVINRKNSCLSCFISAQWNQSFCLKAINWLFTL